MCDVNYAPPTSCSSRLKAWNRAASPPKSSYFFHDAQICRSPQPHWHSMFPNGKKAPHGPSTNQLTGGCKNKIEEYKKAFSFFDANNDGKITMDELEKAMVRCGQRPSKLEIRLIMYHGDNDQNGVITFDEFAHLMNGTSSMNRYTYEQLRDQFSMFDKDKDGFIEKQEMILCVRELSLQQTFPQPVIEQLFTEADIDGDGKISFEEFVLAVN